ncbi:MAG: hypothetical protein MJ252_24605 [archaeon]|nr:hypothetical protein [archaeon]
MELYEEEQDPNYQEILQKGLAEYFIARDFDNKTAVYCFKCKRAFPTAKDHIIHKAYLKSNYYKFDKKIFEKIQSEIKDLEETAKKDKDKFISNVEDIISNFIKQMEGIKNGIKTKYEEEFNSLNNYLTELNSIVEKAKNGVKDYYDQTSNFYDLLGKNQDMDNALFLIHFDLMQDFMKENKNYENTLNKIRDIMNNFPKRKEEELKTKLNEINESLNLNFPKKAEDNFEKPFEKIKKYEEHNNAFIKNVVEIQNAKGDLKKVNDLVKLLDSKTIRGVDFLYSQPYFLEGLNVKTKETHVNTASDANQINQAPIESPQKEPESSTLRTYRLLNSNSRNSSRKNGLGTPNLRGSSAKKSSKHFSNFNDFHNPNEYSIGTGKKLKEEDVSLCKEFIQRYFAYSITNFYNTNFAPQKKEDILKNTEYLLLDYQKRQSILKDYKKPVPGTNLLSVYYPKMNKRIYIEIPLSKTENGYSEFPEGCRALCIDEIVYITGGKDKLGIPLRFMNIIDLKRKELKAFPSMIVPHAFHNIDYLFNYECILVVGGDDYNCNVEMFDLSTSKWNLLPPINYPRINSNLIYDTVGATVHLLFGTQDNKKNSEAIEVMDLSDVKSGWKIINYAKGAFLDVQLNYCKVKQFSRDKFLIYGVTESKNSKKSYAFYLIEKGEIVAVKNQNDFNEIKKLESQGNLNTSLNMSTVSKPNTSQATQPLRSGSNIANKKSVSKIANTEIRYFSPKAKPAYGKMLKGTKTNTATIKK